MAKKRTAHLSTCLDEAMLHIPPADPRLAHDTWADDYERLLVDVDEVCVSGDGWGYDPATAEPSIPPGTYTAQEFICLMRAWEEAEEAAW
jgi:hypothetical protein